MARTVLAPFRRAWPGFSGLPRPTLRLRLALLYGMLIAGCAVAAAVVAELTAPNFLVHSSSTRAPGSAGPATGGCPFPPSPAHPCIFGPAYPQVHPGSVALLAGLVVVAVGAGWLIAGRVLRPLRAITASARAISASNLHERLGLRGPRDEFTELGETLDELFGRLEASFESQRRFVANASHELRTPLAAERALLQVALADPDASAQALRSACEEALVLGGQQERLIDALLTLASSERGIGSFEPFDLAVLARAVVADREEEAARRGVHIEATLAEAGVTGDPRLAESLVANLVDNALRHNLAGGRAEIVTAKTGGQAILSVGNTGPVISPGEVGRLFEPFQRLGGDRLRRPGGHGLGLAIVRAIAAAHGATLTAKARDGGGLDVEVRFP